MSRRPRSARPLPVVPGLAATAAVLAVSFDDRAHRAARRLLPLPERAVVRRVVVGTLALHAVEATTVLRRARRAGMGPAAPRWAASTLLWGVFSFARFRRAARAI